MILGQWLPFSPYQCQALQWAGWKNSPSHSIMHGWAFLWDISEQSAKQVPQGANSKNNSNNMYFWMTVLQTRDCKQHYIYSNTLWTGIQGAYNNTCSLATFQLMKWLKKLEMFGLGILIVKCICYPSHYPNISGWLRLYGCLKRDFHAKNLINSGKKFPAKLPIVWVSKWTEHINTYESSYLVF